MQETVVESAEPRIVRMADGRIRQLALNGDVWFLGQLVKATAAHFGPPAGTTGTVVRLVEPYSETRTSDVIAVDFGDVYGEMYMKPGEVRPFES